VQGNEPKFRNVAGMAVSVRDMLNVEVGGAFGFYASSLTTKLKPKETLSFWDIARDFQKRIERGRKKKNPLTMLVATELDSGLLDSLYFSKYGLIESKMSQRFLGKMNWDKLNYGFSITNVGKVNVPKTYGHLTLECIFGPVVYSDVNEKTVGVTTASDKLTFVLTHNGATVGAEKTSQIRSKVIEKLSEAING